LFLWRLAPEPERTRNARPCFVDYNPSVVIRRSAADEIRTLVDRLTGEDPLRRDAASARLAIIGPRSVATLVRALNASSPAAQAAVLRTLEAIQDPRSVGPATSLVDSVDQDVATAAVSVLRRFLRASDRALAETAFERLTSVTLDPTRPEPIRAAALEALSDLPGEAVAQVARELQNDPSGRLRRAGQPEATAQTRSTLAEIAASARCPDPAELRALVATQAASVPLPVLRRLVDLLRERETEETATSRRTEWQAVRAAVHQALAGRRSRVALYDLRETLALVPGPLPVGFVAALESIGDASCLDDVAAGYVRARRARDPWWTEHLAIAFRSIVAREHLTRRSAALKHVASKWPQAAEELLPRRR
jgi:HEAT repeat protein